MQALAVYLSQFQLLPLARISELVADLWGCQLSDGTIATWIAEAARILEPSMGALKRRLGASRVYHGDETGIRVKGLLRWMYVTATKWLTLYSCHAKRGHDTIHATRVIRMYNGQAMHTRQWS